jgi:hypothetical protein
MAPALSSVTHVLGLIPSLFHTSHLWEKTTVKGMTNNLLVLPHPRIFPDVLQPLAHRFGAAIHPFPSPPIRTLLLRTSRGNRLGGQRRMVNPTPTRNHGAGVAPPLNPQVIRTRIPTRTCSPMPRPRPPLGAAQRLMPSLPSAQASRYSVYSSWPR